MISTLWTNPSHFPTALADSAKAVEAVIDGFLVSPDGPEVRVYDAMRYATLAPGKRLRPFLVLATSQLFPSASVRRCKSPPP